MPLLTVSELQKSFVTRLLFSGVSFEVNNTDRIGLVGVNGSGKTTLFKILRGLEPYDAGSIYKNRDLTIGAMNQNIDEREITLYDYALEESSELMRLESEQDEILERLKSNNEQSLLLKQQNLRERFYDMGGLTYRARTRSVLLGLGFSEDELNQPVSSMSGGQRNKAQLARLLLSQANLLLLDEPTNHLDISAVSWLEDFLLSYPKAFIAISHDRYFLDKVTQRTFELKNQRLFITNGNYSTHVSGQATQQEIALRHYRNTQREIRRIEGIVEQQRRWGQERNFVTAESKLKQIERLKATLVEPEKATASIRFNFKTQDGCANDVLIAENLSKAYAQKQVFSNIDLHIRKGERVFLLGANGCGKTTLLRILSRHEHPNTGSFYYGSRVSVGYYDQNVNSTVGESTLIESLHNDYPTMNIGELRNAMALFLFRGDDVYKLAKDASGGEKARLQLLKLMLSGANMLLLDEPTNHLDITSREALENALSDYDGTMLIVTHDRYLVNKLADRVLYMNKDGLLESVGGYDELLLARQEPVKTEKSMPKSNAYKLQKEHRSALNKAKGELSRIEQRIAEAEATLLHIEDELNSPKASFDYKLTIDTAARATEKRNEIDKLYADWEILAKRVEELEENYQPHFTDK